jgi:beta-glucosidase
VIRAAAAAVAADNKALSTVVHLEAAAYDVNGKPLHPAR